MSQGWKWNFAEAVSKPYPHQPSNRNLSENLAMNLDTAAGLKGLGKG